MTRRRGLDALRGIAVLLVVLAHTTTKTLGGGVGVTIFFVLSGFLITTLLIKELGATGRVRLGAFYIRRALRLFPALLAALALTPLLMLAVGDPRLGAYPIWAVLSGLYLMDYARAAGFPETPFGHTWSLGVEEQFYIVWPLVLLLLVVVMRQRPRNLAAWTGSLSAIALAWRLVAPAVMPEGWTSYALDTNAFSLLLGCFTAALIAAGVRLPSHPAVTWSTLAALAAITCSTIVIDASLVWDYYTVAAALLAAVLVPAASTAAPRLLALRPLIWFGKISYALYLWHFVLLKIHYQGEEPRSLAVRVGLASLSIGMAWASWHLLEKQCLRLKDRFEVSRDDEKSARPQMRTDAQIVR